MKIEKVDIVVLGAGPGGSAFVLSLQEHDPSLSMVLIEQSNFETPRIGETLPPGIQPLLEQLSAWDAFQAQHHHPAFSTKAAWGQEHFLENDFLYYASGNGWILKRHQFDAMLAHLAAERGALLLTETVLSQHWQTSKKACMLQVQDNKGNHRLFQARFVIDATGRKAVYARNQGAIPLSFDQLIGVCGFFSFDSRPDGHQGALIEPFAQGWWYTAPLPDGIRIVACMTDSELAKQMKLRRQEYWFRLLQETKEIKKTIFGGTLSGGPILRPAASQCLDLIYGHNWLAVGDAASCFDPLSSQGVMKALRSGIFASYAVSDWLSKKMPAGLKNYERFVREDFENYLEARAHYYTEEQRWQKEPFWQRRQETIKLTPETIVVCGKKRSPIPPFLSRQTFDLIRALCEQPQPAHAVVRQFRETFENPFSDKRVILTLQHLLESQILEYR